MMKDLTRKELEQKYLALKDQLVEKEFELRGLRRSDEKFRHLFEKSPTAIFITDWKGVLLNVNQAGVEQMGFKTRSDLIGRFSIFDFFAQERDKVELERILEEKGAVFNYDTRLKRVDGDIRDVQITLVTRENVTGKLDGYEGHIRDVTDAKRMETALRSSEERYRTVVEGSLGCIYVFHSGGILQFVNQRLLDVMGYEYDELIGRPFWELVYEGDRETVKQNGLRREIAEIEPRHYPFRLIKRDGTVIWTDSYGTHTTFQGKPAVVGNFIDISKIRQAEEEIRLFSRKLINVIEEERKNLAVDLHDEFGQTLTTLQIDIKLIEQSLPDEFREQRLRCADIMDRINALADSVRSTSARLRPELLDHLGLIMTVQSHVDEYNDRNPGFRVDFQSFGSDKRMEAATELALYRTFQEGFNNAVKHAGADNIRIGLAFHADSAVLRIEDDGIGFEPGEHRPPGDGIFKGIGILSMKERVAMLNGSIVIDSKPGKGTCVQIELPIKNGNKP